MGGVDHGTRIQDGAGRAGVLDEDAAELPVGQALGQVGDHDLDPHPLRPGADDVDRLRQGVSVDDEGSGRVALRAAYERHRLGGGGPLVEEGRVRGGQAGEVADHRLEVEECLEAALRDLGLVGRVGGVPRGVLEHVAPDHRWGDGAVVTQPDHRLGRAVLGRECPQRARCGFLVERSGEVERGGGPDSSGHGRRHQRLERVMAERAEHVGDVVLTGPDVAGDELAERAWWTVRSGPTRGAP